MPAPIPVRFPDNRVLNIEDDTVFCSTPGMGAVYGDQLCLTDTFRSWCDCGNYHYSIGLDTFMAMPSDAVPPVRGAYRAMRSRPVNKIGIYWNSMPMTTDFADAPGGFELLVRLGIGNITSPVWMGAVRPINYQSYGLIAQICGRTFTQVEFYVRAIDGAQGPLTAPPRPTRVSLWLLTSDAGGCDFTTQLGSFTTALPTPPSD